VQVYDNCSFPIFMPNAFTPNQDGKNDVFRVPLQNKNKLVRLSIFNRYGQVVYTTANSGEGWDGTAFNNQPQPGGVYVYYLIMEDLLGNKLQQKGSFLLLR
jgi:gliding motility-associated-like protein